MPLVMPLATVLASTRGKINLAFVLGSVALLVFHLLAPGLEKEFSYHMLFGVVLTLGLVHGCLDYEVEMNTNPRLSKLRFYVVYIVQMLAVGLLWLVSQQVAVIFFFICTAWHFGETDFSLFKLDVHPAIIALYGLGITVWLFGSHLDENLGNLTALGLISESQKDVMALIPRIAEIMTIAAALMIALAAFLSGLYTSLPNMLMLGGVLLVTWFLPLIPAFTAYFGFWHSLHTIHLIKSDIKLSLPKLALKAAPLLGASLSSTALLILAFAYFELSPQAVLLVFISALTLPHAGTMHQLLLRHRQAA